MVVAFVLSPRVHAVDEPASPPAKTATDVKPAAPLVSSIMRVPPGFMSADPGNPSGERTPPSGVKPVDTETGYGRRKLDMRQYLAAAGIHIPPEGEASYYPDPGVMYLRARPEDLDQAEIITGGGWGGMGPAQARGTFTLAGVEATGEAAEEARLSWSELRKRTAASWREIESLSVPATSGHKVTGASASGAQAPGRGPAEGAKAEGG